MNLKVYQVAPAPDRTSQWMSRLLQPVIEAAKFENGPPSLELRQAGQWSGWAAPRDMAPDGRVSLSNLVLFQSARCIRSVYLHEVGHSLLHGVKGATPGHDCPFFALSVCLRMRVDSHRQLENETVSLVSEMGIYDLSDLPPAELSQDVGRCISWSIEVATQLAATDLSAEALAREIVARYQIWLEALRDRPRLDRIASRKAQSQRAVLDRLKDRLFVSNFVAGISGSLLVLIMLMMVAR